MSDLKPQVTRVVQNTTVLPTGELRNSYIVSFVVGPHGPFSVQIPAADFTKENVLAKVNDFASTLNQLPMMEG